MLSTFVILPVPTADYVSHLQRTRTEGPRRRTLHDEEIRVVDVELDALEQTLDLLLGRAVSTNEVFALTVDRDLHSPIKRT